VYLEEDSDLSKFARAKGWKCMPGRPEVAFVAYAGDAPMRGLPQFKAQAARLALEETAPSIEGNRTFYRDRPRAMALDFGGES
jgi:hypothetical protein